MHGVQNLKDISHHNGMLRCLTSRRAPQGKMRKGCCSQSAAIRELSPTPDLHVFETSVPKR